MKILTKIDRHEVLRLWALGEVNSKFYKPDNEYIRLQTQNMLMSGNQAVEEEAYNLVLEFKGGLIDSLSTNIKWYKANLEFSKSDLDFIYTLQLPGWRKNTKGSYLIADAAKNIKDSPTLDSRVGLIYEGLKRHLVSFKGITLLAVDKSGPYVAVEGTGRLTGIYICEKLENLQLISERVIEVTLGLY